MLELIIKQGSLYELRKDLDTINDYMMLSLDNGIRYNPSEILNKVNLKYGITPEEMTVNWYVHQVVIVNNRREIK